ncbi:MAG: redoxin domain-containing protein [Candidatus Cryptobacteroides sp.]
MFFKKLFTFYFSTVFFFSGLVAYAQDTGDLSVLDKKLDKYFASILMLSIDSQENECDFLISGCEDSVVRQHVALGLYDRYFSSKVMGVEAVTIYLIDRWFGSGQIKMRSDAELLNARIFAEFNRSSLIGNQAQNLALDALDGSRKVLFGEKSGKYSVLFFYDADCPKCVMESILLNGFLEKTKYDIDVFAVYVGQDTVKQRAFIEKYFTVNREGVRVEHFSDVEFNSDLGRKYGVLSTPKMFLIDRKGVIAGRNLDTEALATLLDELMGPYKYGGEKSMAFFNMIFEKDSTEEQVLSLADYIKTSTLGAGDTLIYKHISGDLLYYLAGKRGEGFRNAAGKVAEKFVLGQKNVWNNGEDSVSVVGLAEFLSMLSCKAPLGTRIVNKRVEGKLLTAKGEKAGKFSLGKLGKEHSYIVFYSKDCPYCKVELEAVKGLPDKDTSVLLVDVDGLESQFANDFDLSVLPLILETDSYGEIKRRYISFAK